jgi:hypothetical protein
MSDFAAFSPFNGGASGQNLVTSSASSSVDVTGIGRGKADVIRVANTGSGSAWIVVGSVGIVATSAGMAIPPGAVEIFGVGALPTLAALSASGTSTTLNIVSGNGV